MADPIARQHAESNIVEGDIVPALALNGGSIETVKVKRRFFGSNAINVLPASQFEEKLLKGDVDNTIELRDSLYSLASERSTRTSSSVRIVWQGYERHRNNRHQSAHTRTVRLYICLLLWRCRMRIFSMTGSTVIHLGES